MDVRHTSCIIGFSHKIVENDMKSARSKLSLRNSLKVVNQTITHHCLNLI